MRQRMESVRRGVVVSTGFCGFSRCVGAGCVGKLGSVRGGAGVRT